MYFVYFLQSAKDYAKHYVGITDNLERRLSQHNNSPSCSYTIKYSPWKLRDYVAFDDFKKAEKFEIYLKSHSGKAFAKKHF